MDSTSTAVRIPIEPDIGAFCKLQGEEGRRSPQAMCMLYGGAPCTPPDNYYSSVYSTLLLYIKGVRVPLPYRKQNGRWLLKYTCTS